MPSKGSMNDWCVNKEIKEICLLNTHERNNDLNWNLIVAILCLSFSEHGCPSRFCPNKTQIYVKLMELKLPGPSLHTFLLRLWEEPWQSVHMVLWYRKICKIHMHPLPFPLLSESEHGLFWDSAKGELSWKHNSSSVVWSIYVVCSHCVYKYS